MKTCNPQPELGSKPPSAYLSLLLQDAALTARSEQESFETIWPQCERLLDQCVELAPMVTASNRRMIRAIQQYWVTYQYRHTGVYQFPQSV